MVAHVIWYRYFFELAKLAILPIQLVIVACLPTYFAGLILGLRPDRERRRYKVTPSRIGWVQT